MSNLGINCGSRTRNMVNEARPDRPRAGSLLPADAKTLDRNASP